MFYDITVVQASKMLGNLKSILEKAAVFAEGLQHARMRVGLGSKTARSWRSMHLGLRFWSTTCCLPPTTSATTEIPA